jgi:hypothetical protein
MTPTDDILKDIPASATIRLRLAKVLTEADVLRKQLRMSQRTERERLRQLADRGGQDPTE